MIFLGTVILGIAGSAVALKTQSFMDQPYCGCGSDKKCDNPKTLPLARASTNVQDPVHTGTLTCNSQPCETDADCGSFHYTADI